MSSPTHDGMVWSEDGRCWVEPIDVALAKLGSESRRAESPPVSDERCPDCDGSGYTCKGACFGKSTCNGSRCPRGCEPEGLMARTVRSIRDDEAPTRR